MSQLANKFGIPNSLFAASKQVFDESTEYQNKVKAHMAKKGIKSLGDLSAEEKKKFFRELDAMHTAKHEEASVCPVCKKEPCECPTGNHIEESKYEMEPEDEPKEPSEKEKKHSDDLKKKHGTANKKALDKISKAFASKKVNEDMSEAVGGGTSVNTQSLKSAAAQKKRADVAVKIAALKLKQEKEREALQKQKASVKEEVDLSILDEALSPAMIAKLKTEYGKISTIDPSGEGYKKLTSLLDKLEKKDLQTLADAGIKFVSGLARNRVNRMKNESVEIHEGEGIVTPRKKITGEPTPGSYAYERKYGKYTAKGELRKKPNPNKPPVKEDVDEACWDTHKQEGMKKKGDKMVPNCVPKNEAASPAQQAAIAIAMKKAGKKPKDLEEAKSDYDIYHKDFSTAVQHAIKTAEKRGYKVDNDDWDRKVAMGPRKPSEGKTNSYSITLMDKNGKPVKKALQMQVYNKGGQNPYELNMYIEEFDLQESDGPIVWKKGTHSIEQLSDKEFALYDGDKKLKVFPSLDAAKSSLKEEDKYQEYKTGGEPLAKKFEKAFAKMGFKTNIKMRTVNNISVNEAAMKKVTKAAKKMKEQAPSKNDNMKSGDSLSGKKEPIEVNPEIDHTR